MDGLFNKFLSVLREVTDEDKQETNGDKQETNEDEQETNGEELKETNENELKETNEDELKETNENELKETNEDELKGTNENEPKTNEHKPKTNGITGLETVKEALTDLFSEVNVSSEPEPSKSESPESSPSSSTDLKENLAHSLEKDASSEEQYNDSLKKESERIEQCIDVVPVEGLPEPPPGARLVPEYTPSLQHSPSQGVLQRDRPPSPSLFDRSIEFLKREFDSLRFSLGTRPVLTHEEWFNIFNSDGQMLDTEQFYNYLLEYDWPTELLQEGWKYLFEYYETFSNHNERVLIDKNKENELDNLLSLWADILKEEGDNVEKARVQKLIYLINKDVPRTDRDHPFYTSNPENSDVLRDLLVTFCFANPDIGYVQGMNEVLSMFLVTVEHKVAAYWGFSNYVLRNKLFFNSTGLMAKLNGVAELLNIHDPELYNKLKSLDCSNMLFCQRWILLAFKRECKTFDMAVKLFTTINSLKPTHYIQLQGLGKCELLSLDMFLVIAILVSSRATLLSFTDQTDVYQWTGRLKLSDMSAIWHARQMYDEWAKRIW